MLKALLPVLLLLSSFFTHAQFSIGYHKWPKFGKVSKLKNDKLALLKNTTTVFVLPDKDSQNIALFDQAIKSVWTITPYIIARPFEISRYSDKKQYSIFKFRYQVESVPVSTGMHSTGARTSSIHLVYELWIADGKKKNKKSHVIAGIELSPDAELFLMFRASDPRVIDAPTRVHKDATKLLGRHTVYNWGPGFLKGYLKTIQDGVSTQKQMAPMLEFADNAHLANLRNDTLYVPDYVLIKFSPFTANERETDLDDESLGDVYHHPIKFVPTEELNRMIVESVTGIKYLIFTKSSSKKVINVYDSKDNKLIYTYVKNASYNFKYKDLRKLAKEII